MRKAGILAASMLGATLLAAGPVLADPPHCPPGHAKKGWCGGPNWDRGFVDDRSLDRAYEEGYRDAMRDAFRVGDRLPGGYRVVPDFYDRGWPVPGDGRGYVEYDGRYYLINLATGLILDALMR